MDGAVREWRGASNIEKRETYQVVKQEKPPKEGMPFELGLKGWLGAQERVRGKPSPWKESITKMRRGRGRIY